VERHPFLDYPLRLRYLTIRGLTEHHVVRTGFEPINVVINQRLVVGYTGFKPRIITPFEVRSATHIESYLSYGCIQVTPTRSVYQFRHLTIFEDEKSSVLYVISNTGFTKHLVFIPFSQEQHNILSYSTPHVLLLLGLKVLRTPITDLSY
jgi:hypothetical protein